MDNRFGCHLFILLFMFSGLDNIRMLNIERDVIFTPNQMTQVAGKTLYYNPSEANEIDRNRHNNNIDDYIVEQNVENRWLEPLKHSLYLMLNNKINSNASTSDVILEESIQLARFLELNNGHNRNSRFGDVINLVNGKLEIDRNGVFQLVEIHDNCIKYCLEESIDEHNITAFWSVYKIRHRDEKRGYRYELKFTIRRLQNSPLLFKRNDDHSANIRSFLLRDQDYPKFFEEAVVKKKKLSKMEKRIFNTLYDNAEQPFNLDYRAHPSQQYDQDNLNTGEYYAKGSTQDVRYQVHNPQEVATENANVHHHYFLNKNEVPIFKSSHYEKLATFPDRYNALNFPNNHVVPPNQVSIPRVHSQLDSYGEILQTTSQTPFQFPNHVNFQEQQRTEFIRPTTYRGHYDDNRESILDGEVKRDNFVHHSNRNQLIQFPVRHTHVIDITSTPSTYAINLNRSPAPSIQTHYNKQYTHTNGIQPAELNQNYQHSYWFGQHPHQQNFNFVGSYPYRDDIYSELDPIYHGPLATPSDIPSSSVPGGIDGDIHDADAGFVSQLPLQTEGDGFSSYDIPMEVHQTTSTNTDPSFTTPYNFVTTTQVDSSQSEDKSKPFPDSINAQLPPPDSGADTRIPYVDESTPRKKSNRKHNEKIKVIISEESGDDSDDDNDDSLSFGKPSIENIVQKTTKKSTQNRYKNSKNTSTTEKPSWTPKRPRLRNSDKYKTNSELVKRPEKIPPSHANRRKLTLRKVTTTTAAAPTSVTQEFNDESSERVTASTTHVPKIEEQPRTTQSVRKSVSVHIAEKVTVMPKKSTKMVQNSSKHGENLKLRRVARVRKVEKNIADNSSTTAQSLEQ
ncbi:uncharacterized protein LOC116342818 [Contarinia nasturtii]|uniref:uncharacterized protein LOC116342818 n=1 Tax=Contarinia nasturtii TaxID=265458 RepID=UPI0012D3E883|nr:uncharacterized protein LOC116342818 [Contarinia nasturtii]